ncbi:hypothetical protein CMO96_02240 [Candidatus Woesebacteria bacterium]|nr:hypothetical protein [Candidatus Woesebacteria bacterium]|tara:strand:+ start:59 stop:556 length:498 start_codon:yes stop_codon:yes gene_type:complete
MATERLQLPDVFLSASNTLKEITGVHVQSSDLRGEMQRLWGEVQLRTHGYGEWKISSLKARFFEGPKPLVVNQAKIYVSKVFGTVHEAVFDENPHIKKSESPIGGFEWPFRIPLVESLRGFFEADFEDTLPHFPLDQIDRDLKALEQHLKKQGLIRIPKAIYMPF